MNKKILLSIIFIISTTSSYSVDLMPTIQTVCDAVSHIVKTGKELFTSEKPKNTTPSPAPTELKDIKDAVENVDNTLKDGFGTVEKDMRIMTTFQKTATIGTTISAIGSAVYILKSSYDFGCWSKSFFWPSEKEQLEAKNVSRQLRVLKAEEKLDQCLVINARKSKNDDGLPSACQDHADLFAATAGYGALHKKSAEFKAYFQKEI